MLVTIINLFVVRTESAGMSRI